MLANSKSLAKVKKFLKRKILWFGQVLPVFHALMGRKTQVAYEAVLGHIKAVTNTPDQWDVIMADFELALRNACRVLFPNARLSGCEVHYKRVSLTISVTTILLKFSLSLFFMFILGDIRIC